MICSDKIYGNIELSGVILDLVNTNAFQRLKKVHQGGAIFLVNPTINHTRYEHSIGVMYLIQYLGGSIKAQIAGLIHDISHTAFSHLIDYVLEFEGEDYHELRFEKVLVDSEIPAVLMKHGFELKDFLDLDKYQLLEYPLPSLSADRVDYTLRDLFQIGKITKAEVQWFLQGLKVFEGRIVLADTAYGNWFQEKYGLLVEDYFGSKENIEANAIMKHIIKDCINKEVLVESDFFQDDYTLIDKINASFDLKKRMEELKGSKEVNLELNYKKRFVNPEVLVGSRVVRLGEL